MKKEGRTILFVTHDMGAIQRFCDRAMLLEKGRMVTIGDPIDVSHRYNELNFGRSVTELGDDRSDEDRRGEYRDADITDAWFENAAGARISAVAHREPCTIAFEVRFNAPLDNPVFGVALRNTGGATVFATTTEYVYGPTGRFAAGETTVVRLRFDTWFTTSGYTVTPTVVRAGLGSDTIDLRPDMAAIVVHGGKFTTGVVDVPHEFELERR